MTAPCTTKPERACDLDCAAVLPAGECLHLYEFEAWLAAELQRMPWLGEGLFSV